MYLNLDTLALCAIALGLLVFSAYWLGAARAEQQASLEGTRELSRGRRYIEAVYDFDLWCGGKHPAFRLIADHLLAVGEDDSPMASFTSSKDHYNVIDLTKKLMQVVDRVPEDIAEDIRTVLDELHTTLKESSTLPYRFDADNPNQIFIGKDSVLTSLDLAIAKIELLLYPQRVSSPA